MTLKPLLHYALSFCCVGNQAQRKLNEHATQIVLPILHLDFFNFYFGKCGVIFTDYEICFSKFDHHICKKGC